MRTGVRYWPVGSIERHLELTATDIAAHLIADWIPGLPSASPLDLLGWPGHLLIPVLSRGRSYLTMHPIVAGCERQWKGVMSWMLGVACSRRVLLEEGYQWVAPASAFYPNVNTPVSTSHWHHRYPSSTLKIDRRPGSTSKLRPDYVAIRPVADSSAIEWALAESKGTSSSLSSMTCPLHWSAQVHNATVEAAGLPIPIARHLVIATRVNPNAKLPATRRLQVRAWNSSVSAPTDDFGLAKIEVIAASLFGICRNLDLIHNANAIARATRMRRKGQAAHTERSSHDDLINMASQELKERGIEPSRHDLEFYMSVRYRGNGFSRLRVNIEPTTLRMIEAMQRLVTPFEDIRLNVMDLDREIHSWYEDQRPQRTETKSILPEGVVVQLN